MLNAFGSATEVPPTIEHPVPASVTVTA